MSDTKLRNFHEAQWDESLIFEQSVPGSRSLLVPDVSGQVKGVTGDVEKLLPENLKRKGKPALPELAQPQVLRHYLRLSQETIGQDINIDIGLGTCTMKYSPKINEQFVRSPKFTEMHPYQDDDTAQGVLKIIYDFEQIMKEISGLDSVSFQPGGGGQGIYSNAAVLKKYFEEKGEAEQRTQIITTILSHPLDSAAPATKGFEVISLFPNENGYPSLENLKAVVSEKTAGIFITNPEDTGVFNPIVREFVDVVHEAGGLAICDMADYNGLFGLVRAKELGADMCHFNLHKAFSSPHGCMGPGCGAQCVSEELEKYLPRPRVRFDGKRYYTDYDGPASVGKIRQFHGSLAAVMRSYAWVMSLGRDGLETVAETAILNNNYMMKRVLNEVKGISMSWAEEAPNRLEQVRYSFEKLLKDTGVGAEDVNRHLLDFGFQRFFASHHPLIVPEPYTPEPTESYSKADIDEYVSALKKISDEAYSTPEVVLNAPYNGPISKLENDHISDWRELAVTWRAYKKQNGLA
ncbi:aminomethyl-transferring glycine dehydrogenase subunit GcvPB [Oscillibacter sp. MSJ-2]|uniref:Aminomethyl-transferring glycine dehydrogenase subunit GcvPB n=1 Tax=Dysosmobacter acutus TaxID=2841504 RepID=A0ABS6F6C4_9FIRM|nr:aminomethyl-transferring glycine dehydrogenase subunit GcvPB [Dysosmobacter acutus]